MSCRRLVIAIIACCGALASGEPTTAPTDAGDEYGAIAARVFRTQATIHAAQMRIYATEAEMLSEKDRDQLLRVLDEFERKVDAEAEQIRLNPPSVGDIIHRAEPMGLRFDVDVLEPWLTAQPDVQAAIDRQQLIFELVIDDLPDGGQGVLAAAQRAGLPKSAENRARDVVQEALDGVQIFFHGIEKRQQAAARAPKDSASYLDETTILSDVEMFKLETARTVRQKLRELIPTDRHTQFDDELAKLAGN